MSGLCRWVSGAMDLVIESPDEIGFVRAFSNLELGSFAQNACGRGGDWVRIAEGPGFRIGFVRAVLLFIFRLTPNHFLHPPRARRSPLIIRILDCMTGHTPRISANPRLPYTRKNRWIPRHSDCPLVRRNRFLDNRGDVCIGMMPRPSPRASRLPPRLRIDAHP